MSLTDTQIKDLAKKMSVPLGGVCFKDEIPKLDFNKVYIINMEDSVDESGQLNPGTHWVMLEVAKCANGEICPLYFDPYGVSPPENVKKTVKQLCPEKHLVHTKKDIQSLMNNACGFYCLAMAHFINASKYRSGHIYDDVGQFLEFFDDLNVEVDFKKNEFILKQFFVSADPALRKQIDVIKPIDSISKESEKGGIDAFKIPIHVKQL